MLRDRNLKGGGYVLPLPISVVLFSKPTGLLVNLRIARGVTSALGKENSCWSGLRTALLPQTPIRCPCVCPSGTAGWWKKSFFLPHEGFGNDSSVTLLK